MRDTIKGTHASQGASRELFLSATRTGGGRFNGVGHKRPGLEYRQGGTAAGAIPQCLVCRLRHEETEQGNRKSIIPDGGKSLSGERDGAPVKHREL